MAKAIIVPRPINGRVPSKVDDHRPRAPLLLALLLSPSISISCVILFPSLLTFKEILTSKESCERKEIFLFWTPSIRRTWSQNQQLIQSRRLLLMFSCSVVSNSFATPWTPAPEKAMAPHSSTLAWKIPWVEKPGRLQSMVSRRVRHNWTTSLSLFTFMHWRRKWQPTPVSLPGESQGWRSLVGCRLWGLTESDTTEAT